MKYVYGIMLNEKIIAFHKKESVIKRYAYLYNTTNEEEKIFIVKMKKENASKNNEYDDLYLVECMPYIYIQKKYIDTYLIMFAYVFNKEEMDLYDQYKNLSNDCKDPLKIIKKELKNLTPIIPSLRCLKENEMMLEEYRYKSF